MTAPQSARAAEKINAIIREWANGTCFSTPEIAAIIEAEFGWKPIGEAPQDGSLLLLIDARDLTGESWVGRNLTKFNPTHFQTITPPPDDL